MNKVLSVNQQYLRKIIENGSRKDGRKLDEYRNIEIIPDFINESAEGSCLVKIGKTKVLAGVKISMGTPFPDSPEDGVLMVGTELAPIGSEDFELGPPGEDAIELARVIDRGIRESKMIDTKKLCIVPKEKVYMVSVDLHVLDHDGNLLDAAGLAAVVALLTTTVPEYDEKTENLNFEKKGKKLKLNDLAISITARVINNKTIFDPDLGEEGIEDARLTVAFTEEGKICAMQKGGSAGLSIKEIMDIVEQSKKVSDKLRKEVKALKIK